MLLLLLLLLLPVAAASASGASADAAVAAAVASAAVAATAASLPLLLPLLLLLLLAAAARGHVPGVWAPVSLCVVARKLCYGAHWFVRGAAEHAGLGFCYGVRHTRAHGMCIYVRICL